MKCRNLLVHFFKSLILSFILLFCAILRTVNSENEKIDLWNLNSIMQIDCYASENDLFIKHFTTLRSHMFNHKEATFISDFYKNNFALKTHIIPPNYFLHLPNHLQTTAVNFQNLDQYLSHLHHQIIHPHLLLKNHRYRHHRIAWYFGYDFCFGCGVVDLQEVEQCAEFVFELVLAAVLHIDLLFTWWNN